MGKQTGRRKSRHCEALVIGHSHSDEIALVDDFCQSRYFKSCNDRKAFTLAEVLITLGIIGIVASMTIPTLMNNIADAQYRTAWKKAFSVFSQATQKMAYDNGGDIAGLFSTSDDIRDNYVKYLIKAKVCTDSNAEGCWAADATGLDGTTGVFGAHTGLILNDGSLAIFWLADSNCSASAGISDRCAGAAIDVNGMKPPNKIGKDIYEFHILKNRILPYGTQGDDYNVNNDCDPTKLGESCSAVYLYQ
jgi:prepilin-type N-terminal cleavage/methylation domain-containing protein